VVLSYLIPALSIACLATALSIIILLAERYLMDYGEVELKVNDRTFRVKGGATVLGTLKQLKIFIPSACGGRATCSYCKVKAIEGFGDILPTEAPLLTKEDIAQNVRLSCQIKVKNNCAIEIPDSLFSIREFRARVDYVSDLTYDIKHFRFKLHDPSEINYKAGQYIQFQSQPYGDISESVYRAYSMCGRAEIKDEIELMVRLVPEGICTTYMFKHIKIGDEVVLTGPYGEFYLRDNGHRIICIAGGSGMAPIRSILLGMTPEEIEKRRPVFFFGAKAKRDLFMLEEWLEFESRNPGFKFIPALSGPETEDNWDGEIGRITDVVTKYVPDGADCEGYLCGSPGLLDACIEVLGKLGINEERIYYDKFT
jgi:Na+-transporting NADH:ubiquinone oxidoreductase subunit F